jgi:cellulose synthase/poly-beta-1,6-N-acetylglucosamine synthase-like glycosyltransferase
MSLESGIRFLMAQDLESLIRLFWFTTLLEFPRFMIAAVVAAGVALAPKSRNEPELKGTPLVSVLLPTHNGAKTLSKTVISIREQTWPRIELIVVDDGSVDSLRKVADGLYHSGLIDQLIGTQVRGGKAAAANLALGYATGEFIVITDNDTTFDSDAIARVIQPFADSRVGGVSGNLASRNWNSSPVTAWQTIQYLTSISLGRRFKSMLGLLFVASGAFGAFRHSAIKACGGWPVGPGEDGDITLKLRRAGWHIRFAADAWSLTDVPETFSRLTNQRMRWNRSMFRRRVRKFRNVLNPFNGNFNFRDALGTLDILYFQVLIPFSYVAYVIWLFFNFGEFAWIIIIAVHALYVVWGLIHWLLAACVSGHYARWRLWPYALSYGVFNGLFLRLVAVNAFLDELIFRSSYSDPYVPQKVRKRLEKF